MPLPRPRSRASMIGIFSFSSEAPPSRAAAGALDAVVAGGAAAYERSRVLPRLLPLALARLPVHEPALTAAILIRLARGLRSERRLGRAGHWTYDVNRHIALAQAFRAERHTLERLVRGGRR
jgi:hypothetical protein